MGLDLDAPETPLPSPQHPEKRPQPSDETPPPPPPKEEGKKPEQSVNLGVESEAGRDLETGKEKQELKYKLEYKLTLPLPVKLKGDLTLFNEKLSVTLLKELELNPALQVTGEKKRRRERRDKTRDQLRRFG